MREDRDPVDRGAWRAGGRAGPGRRVYLVRRLVALLVLLVVLVFVVPRACQALFAASEDPGVRSQGDVGIAERGRTASGDDGPEAAAEAPGVIDGTTGAGPMPNGASDASGVGEDSGRSLSQATHGSRAETAERRGVMASAAPSPDAAEIRREAASRRAGGAALASAVGSGPVERTKNMVRSAAAIPSDRAAEVPAFTSGAGAPERVSLPDGEPVTPAESPDASAPAAQETPLTKGAASYGSVPETTGTGAPVADAPVADAPVAGTPAARPGAGLAEYSPQPVAPVLSPASAGTASDARAPEARSAARVRVGPAGAAATAGGAGAVAGSGRALAGGVSVKASAGEVAVDVSGQRRKGALRKDAQRKAAGAIAKAEAMLQGLE